jgi:hypothetical protein
MSLFITSPNGFLVEKLFFKCSENAPFYFNLLICKVKFNIYFDDQNILQLYSLSRREESRKHKLFACLLA